MNTVAPTTPTPPHVEDLLADRIVAFLAGAEDAGQDETLRPWEAVTFAGGRAVLIHPDEDDVGAFRHLDAGGLQPTERKLSEADAADYDALVLPGSPAERDRLGENPDVARFVTSFFLARKPIAALCHAPRLLVRAGLVDDRMLTSEPGLREEITRAGGVWHDYPVVVCCGGRNVLITARAPEDLSQFCEALVVQIAHSAARTEGSGRDGGRGVRGR